MNYEDQLDYIDQLIQRFRNDLYDRAMIDESKKSWELISSYNSSDSETRCDFVHQNGNRCNKPIKNIFVAKNYNTREIIKVGSTCLKKLLGIPKEIIFKAGEFYFQNEELNKKENLLKSALQESEKLASSDSEDLRIFSDQQKELIIDRARHLTIVPPPMKRLLSTGIPLSSREYDYLYRNIKRLAKERREKERIERENQEAKKQKEIKVREEVSRKAQEERAIVQKEMQEEKRVPLNTTSSEPSNLPYLFGEKGRTDIDINLTEPLIKVFVESGIDKENLKLNEEELLFLAKKLSNYFCESKCSSQDNNDISLALIMRTIRKYYDLSSIEQASLQKKIKEKVS